MILASPIEVCPIDRSNAVPPTNIMGRRQGVGLFYDQRESFALSYNGRNKYLKILVIRPTQLKKYLQHPRDEKY